MDSFAAYAKAHWGKPEVSPQCSHKVCSGDFPENACADCMQAMYCSTECQAGDWIQSHQYTCIGQNPKRESEEESGGDEDQPKKKQSVFPTTETFPLADVPRDVLSLIAPFLGGEDLKAFSAVARRFSVAARQARFSNLRFDLSSINLDDPALRPIILSLRRVLDVEGHRALALYQLQTEAMVRNPISDLKLTGEWKLRPSMEAVARMTSLEHLDFAAGNWDIPEGFFRNFNRLQTVTLKYGNGRHLNELCELPTLLGVKFLPAHMPGLPRNIGMAKMLRELILDNNLIDGDMVEFPAEIGQLQNLQKLVLNKCKITSLPAAIGGLVSLESLILTSNIITVLPDEICKLSRLKVLNLWNNYLEELPAQLGSLLALELLDVGRNRIAELPLGITANPKLRIRIMGNKAR